MIGYFLKISRISRSNFVSLGPARLGVGAYCPAPSCDQAVFQDLRSYADLVRSAFVSREGL